MLKYIRYALMLLSTLTLILLVLFVVIQSEKPSNSLYTNNFAQTPEYDTIKLSHNLFDSCNNTKIINNDCDEQIQQTKDFSIEDVKESFATIVNEAKKYKKIYDEISRFVPYD